MGVRGSVTLREERHGGRERGKGDEGIVNLKTNVISAAAERKQCLSLGEACQAACSRGWVQHYGMTLLLNVFCLCFCQLQRCSVCTGKRNGENRVDCVGKLVLVDTVVQFHINR